MIDASLIGQFVEIEADIDPAGNFIAVHVEAKEDLGGDNVGTRFLITGTLNAVDTAADPDTITINGLVLDVADASGLVDLVGRRVRLKGTFDETGLLVLDEADPEARNVIRIEDLIESVDQSAGALITRLGVPVTLADASRLQFIGEGAEDDDQQTPDDILARVEPGARLLARGVLEDDGSVIWTRILINDDDDEDCSLRAPVAANTVSDPVFDLLTVTVDTTSLADSEFEDDDDNEIGRTAFFAALEEGVLVKAESDEEGQGCTGGSLSTFNSGEVSLAGVDDVFGNAPDGFVTGSQIEGDITAVDSDAMTFVLGERVLNVSRNTLIDSDLIEAARGEEIEEDFLPFGALTESLGELLVVGDAVEVRVTANGLAALIEAAED